MPARMAASRFPGKPLHSILGKPMVEHCFERAKLFLQWNYLAITTCDEKIRQFGNSKNYEVVMTAATHTRALDRVTEAAELCKNPVADDDIIVCVQGDEPLLGPDIIEMIIDPLLRDPSINGTVLAVPIVDEETFFNPDTVKLVHNRNFDILYTSGSKHKVVPCDSILGIKSDRKLIVSVIAARSEILSCHLPPPYINVSPPKSLQTFDK